MSAEVTPTYRFPHNEFQKVLALRCTKGQELLMDTACYVVILGTPESKRLFLPKHGWIVHNTGGAVQQYFSRCLSSLKTGRRQWWWTEDRLHVLQKKKRLGSEGSQTAPARPSGKSSTCTKMAMEQRWNDTDRVRAKYARKSCSITTLCTTNLTWTGLKLNPGLC